VYLNNPGLNDAGNFIITPNGEMILSVIMLGFVFLMLVKGLRYFVKLMWLFWAGVMISLALIIFLLASNTTSSFISSFNSWSAIFNPSTPDFYHYVMNNVTQSGISLSYNFNWFDTFGTGVYAAIVSLFWAMVTCGNLGEIKNATVVKNQVIMVTGGTVVAGVLMVFIGGLLQHVTGFEFVKAFSYAYTVGSISFPIAPFPASFASVLTHNPIIVTLIMIGVFFTALNILFEITVYGTRVAVSMAFDRVLPKALADVSPKWNAPLKAQLLFFIGGLIGCAIYFYVPNSFYYTLSIYVPTMFSLGITQLSGAIFPFVRKETYNASPIARYKVGNVPLITVTGLISFAYLVIAICYMFAVPALGIVYLWPLVAIGVTMLLAVLWYFGWKAHQKKKGIDITLAFKEVPPE